MKKTLASKIAVALNESISESESSQFETITLRPNEDVSAMIGALNELLRQPVSTLFVDEMSERLCELLLESKGNQSLILGLLEEPPQSGSALALLMRREAIREVHDHVPLQFEN